MLFEQDAPSSSRATPAARLTADIPHDQALGLRLMALARAAATMHMGVQVPIPLWRGPGGGLEPTHNLQNSQASGLFSPGLRSGMTSEAP